MAMLSAAEIQAGHMCRYGNQAGGAECYQEMIKKLVAVLATG